MIDCFDAGPVVWLVIDPKRKQGVCIYIIMLLYAVIFNRTFLFRQTWFKSHKLSCLRHIISNTVVVYGIFRWSRLPYRTGAMVFVHDTEGRKLGFHRAADSASTTLR